MSKDLTNWRGVASGTTTNLKDVAFGNNNFTAVGDDGVILTSKNGETWQKVKPIDNEGLLEVYYYNNKFFVLSEVDTISESSNGMQWTSQGSDTGTSFLAFYEYQRLTHIIWDGERYIAVGVGDYGTILVCGQ